MKKPIWVFVTGTYRTGSTTQYRIAEAVVQRALTDSAGKPLLNKDGSIRNNGVGIGYHKEERLVEHDTDKVRYVVCKVFRYLPYESQTAKTFLRENRVRVLGTVRDPRDIFVSMQERERRSGRIADWDPKKRITEDFPEWFSWFNTWASLPKENVLITKFEDMILDLPKEALRIAAFLRIPLNAKVAHNICKPFQVQAMEKAKKDYWAMRHKLENRGEDAPREHPVLPSIPGVEFGTSGHWKTWLHPHQARQVADSAYDYMVRWGYS